MFDTILQNNKNESNSLSSSPPITRLSGVTPAGLQQTGLPQPSGPIKPKTIFGLRPGAPVNPLTVWSLNQGATKSPKSKKKGLQKGFSRRGKYGENFFFFYKFSEFFVRKRL